MKLTDPQTEKEIAGAWALWQALHEFSNTLWDRYEDPFVEFCQRETSIDDPPHLLDVDLDEFDDEDIPF